MTAIVPKLYFLEFFKSPAQNKSKSFFIGTRICKNKAIGQSTNKLIHSFTLKIGAWF